MRARWDSRTADAGSLCRPRGSGSPRHVVFEDTCVFYPRSGYPNRGVVHSGRGTAGGRLAVAALGVATALLGSAFAFIPPAPAATVAGCSRSLPVVAHRAGGSPVKLPRGDRLPVACASETGYASSESSLAVTPNGVLVYSPAQTENSMA